MSDNKEIHGKSCDSQSNSLPCENSDSAQQRRPSGVAVPDYSADEELLEYIDDPELFILERSLGGCVWHIPWLAGLAISVPLLLFRSAHRDYDHPGWFGGATLSEILIGLVVTFSPFVAIPLLVMSLAYVGIPLVSKLVLRKPANTYDGWRSIVPKDEDSSKS